MDHVGEKKKRKEKPFSENPDDIAIILYQENVLNITFCEENWCMPSI